MDPKPDLCEYKWKNFDIPMAFVMPTLLSLFCQIELGINDAWTRHCTSAMKNELEIQVDGHSCNHVDLNVGIRIIQQNSHSPTSKENWKWKALIWLERWINRNCLPMGNQLQQRARRTKTVCIFTAFEVIGRGKTCPPPRQWKQKPDCARCIYGRSRNYMQKFSHKC